MPKAVARVGSFPDVGKLRAPDALASFVLKVMLAMVENALGLTVTTSPAAVPMMK